MNYMCYYINHGVMHFSIKFEKSGNELSGSDKPERLHYIAEHYKVRTIERFSVK